MLAAWLALDSFRMNTKPKPATHVTPRQCASIDIDEMITFHEGGRVMTLKEMLDLKERVDKPEQPLEVRTRI